MTLLDYSNLSGSKFWDKLLPAAAEALNTLQTLWNKAGTLPLSQEEGIQCLNALYIHTHARIAQYNKNLKANYPTKQFTKNQLQSKSLWWVDHFTTGINQWNTLNWFSSAKVEKPNGSVGYPGASTHFVLGYTGYPFYIIPIVHGAWHEPARNHDSIAIEMVNAGKLHLENGEWHFWSGKLPSELIEELPPVRIAPPFRGCDVMQPFTTEQIANNIKLKRVILAALPGKLAMERMTAHTDWREGKTDTGPLWPFKDVNDAAYDGLPINTYSFVQQYDLKVDKAATGAEAYTYDEVDNPEYGVNSPTHIDDPDPQVKIYTTKEVQEKLVKLGYRLVVDDDFGPKTQAAVKAFQTKWNIANPDSVQLKQDGIPGPQTCKRLGEATK